LVRELRDDHVLAANLVMAGFGDPCGQTHPGVERRRD
jgi:hypothetical protein